MARPARVSPERILAAAAAEFAARGFAGARVDRIARRARVNKAMLYYHFGNKQALYRELLRGTFSRVAAALQALVEEGGSAEEVLDRMIATIARVAEAHPFLPAVMLREIAEGGTHLDRDTMAAMAGLPRAFASVIGKGVQAGTMRPLNPLIAYFSTVAPIMLFTASAPIRKEMAGTQQLPFAMPEREAFITHVQHMLRRSLAADGRDTQAPAATSSPR